MSRQVVTHNCPNCGRKCETPAHEASLDQSMYCSRRCGISDVWREDGGEEKDVYNPQD